MDIKNITVGADPEFFLISKEGYYVPAIGLIGGTKDNPKYISDRGHAIQEDNVMVEFNIPPSSTPLEFANNIEYVIGKIKNRIEDDLDIMIKPCAEFEPLDLIEPQAMMSGCDPDYDAWTREENGSVDLSCTQERYAAGHVHVGYDNPLSSTSVEIAKAMDMYLGVPSVILDRDDRRRNTYGKAGNHRIKPFGVEYRTLSNFWISNNDLMLWVFNNTNRAINFLNDGGNPNLFKDDILDIINNSKYDKAIEFCKDNHILYPNVENYVKV